MITVEVARRIITERVSALPPAQVELSSALGRVLRESVAADDCYPSADRSMMDGYALSSDDFSERFRVVGDVTPGIEPGFTIRRGECARIFTGGILPSGADQVLMQEDARREDDWMMPIHRTARRFVRLRGEEARAGEIVLPAGAILGPADLAILAQVGATRPKVSPIPTITHIATGEELINPSEKPRGGQIRDTNSTLLRALADQCGARIHAHNRLGDNLRIIVSFAADHPANMLLISGGASVGDHDFGARALRELGYTIHFDRVNLRPGKPLTFATRDEHAAFVIPGNPVSHFVCFHVAVRLAIECMQGRQPRWSFIHARLGGPDPLRADPRETFWPARVEIDRTGEFQATPRHWSSSGDTFSLAGTNALMRVSSDIGMGEPVSTLFLDPPEAGAEDPRP